MQLHYLFIYSSIFNLSHVASSIVVTKFDTYRYYSTVSIYIDSYIEIIFSVQPISNFVSGINVDVVISH